MSKIRSDAIWHNLPAEQRHALENWLFEEHVSYKEAAERAQREWGVTGSTVSLCRFYRKVEEERVAGELETAAETATRVHVADGKVEGLHASALKVMAMRLQQNAISRGDVKELGILSRALARNEDRKIQNERLALARKKFEFNAAKAALSQMKLMEKLNREDQEREDERIDEARLGIFGTPPADVIYEY